LVAVAHAAVARQQSGKGSTSGQFSGSEVQGCVNGLPLFSAGIGDGSRFSSRPLPRSPVVIVSPSKDLIFGEKRQPVDIADPAVLGQQLGQRALARKFSESSAQSIVYAHPILMLREGNLAAGLTWPFSRYFMISIRPTENFFHC
jgi:hypothetical protein